MYRDQAWRMRSSERRKVHILEMKYLRSLVGVSRMDRVRNEEVRRRAGIERELANRADQRVLRWFGHVERMGEHRTARRVLIAEVSGGPARGRPRLGWMDGLKMALGNRVMTVQAARQCAKDRKSGEPWYICNWISFTRSSLLSPMFFRTALPCSGGYHLERGGMPLHDAVGIHWKKSSTTENQAAGVKYMY